MGAKHRLVYESEHLKVIRRGSNGRKSPACVVITMPPLIEGAGKRIMTITFDELFDLTEVLDDLCDAIEDNPAIH